MDTQLEGGKVRLFGDIVIGREIERDSGERVREREKERERE